MFNMFGKYISSRLILVIIGSLVACSGGGSNSEKSTIELPSGPPTISKVTYCYRTGDSLTINGSGFVVNTGNATNEKVYICDSPNWNNRNVCENQIYSSWSDISINITVGLGPFDPGSTGYLYVSDNAGDVNQNGYPVTFCSI